MRRAGQVFRWGLRAPVERAAGLVAVQNTGEPAPLLGPAATANFRDGLCFWAAGDLALYSWGPRVLRDARTVLLPSHDPSGPWTSELVVNANVALGRRRSPLGELETLTLVDLACVLGATYGETVRNILFPRTVILPQIGQSYGGGRSYPETRAYEQTEEFAAMFGRFGPATDTGGTGHTGGTGTGHTGGTGTGHTGGTGTGHTGGTGTTPLAHWPAESNDDWLWLLAAAAAAAALWAKGRRQ